MRKRSFCLNAQPLAVFGAILCLLLCRSARGQDPALDLFHKMQRALGGADKIAAIRDFEETVQADVWDNGHVAPLGRTRKLTRWVRPNILRLDQIAPEFRSMHMAGRE